MNFQIKNLGNRNIPSPLKNIFQKSGSQFISDNSRVLYDVSIKSNKKQNNNKPEISFEKAGPREKIYFDPSKVRAAIITCGGLCPGFNNVIRAIVTESFYMYKSCTIFGFPYGYHGLNPENGYKPIELNPNNVKDIHNSGGTILGSSRGGTDDMDKIVDTLERFNINILYAIGGDGTLRGAHEIAKIALKRKLNLSVIGVPKTIDNDLSYVQRSFGFETAFSKAVDSVNAAHVEAKGAPNGIGLVKVMGRHSGFIAASATLATSEVNFVLIPEVPFDIEGENGLLAHIEKRLANRYHAVICVAEGAAQDLIIKDPSHQKKDASGNLKLADIGLYLQNRIQRYFDSRNITINLKYIDPSYIIRSAPANPNDSIFCTILGQYAVHAGMAGKTDIIIGQWNNVFTHIPIEAATHKRNQINPNSMFWKDILAATGQPENMKNN
ncbi:MAG: ATP-dependent 6-phosphofructokinase [Spirochaetota bacterium]|nr:ATP-dependent 6-phosphofructokinase [Spirochaetota bacterium]